MIVSLITRLVAYRVVWLDGACRRLYACLSTANLRIPAAPMQVSLSALDLQKMRLSCGKQVGYMA
jgi:hypothetical protein